MHATSSLFTLSLIPQTSLQRTHLFHPSVSHPSRLRTMAPSLVSRYCPMTGSYSPAPRSEGPNDVFIIRGLHKLEPDFAETQGEFKWEGTPEQITRFTEKTLVGKTLRPPEDFYFEGA